MGAHRRPQRERSERAALHRSGWIALALVGSLTGCEPVSEWRQPNIVLISVDTLRADRLPIYGHESPTAPRVSELAAESAIFDRAYTHTPHTLAAHTSLMTGLYPGRHGVFFRGNTLATSEATLAEILSAHGYRSLAVVNALYLAPQFRVDRGFEIYDYAHDVHVGRNAEGTNEKILELLAEPSDRPFFLFAHYFDAHSDWEEPYEAPAAYVEKFAGAPPEGYRLGRGRGFASRQMLALNRRGRRLDDSEREYLARLYDAGVAYTDDRVGALLDALRSSGQLEHTIILLTSDHGEEFQDHGELLHAQVYEELVRVPLLVSMPEMRGSPHRACRPRPDLPGPPRAGRVDAVVQLADVFATLTDCLGLETPARVQGISFLGALSGGPGTRRWAYFESPHARQRAVLQDHWKLVEFHDRPPRLFDLSRDPGEGRDLSADQPERMRELSRELARYGQENSRTRSKGEDFEVPLDVEQALEALGYAEGPGDREPPTAGGAQQVD